MSADALAAQLFAPPGAGRAQTRHLLAQAAGAHARLLATSGAAKRSGLARLRPIVLTAGAAMLGAWPITLDPIFSGLAWSLVFGIVASTAFTLVNTIQSY